MIPRSVIVGLAVTLVYVGHATIPLRAWRTSDSPRYPVGLPLVAAFIAGGIVAILGMYWYVRKYPDILKFGLNFRAVASASDAAAAVSSRDGSVDFGRGKVGIQVKNGFVSRSSKETTKTLSSSMFSHKTGNIEFLSTIYKNEHITPDVT